jgi:cytosine/adenosine deaminase-related metal-dependent hydrolase
VNVRTVIEGCAIATVDLAGTEYRDGHLVIEGDRIAAIGEGPAPHDPEARRIDGRGRLATPGIITSTSGPRADAPSRRRCSSGSSSSTRPGR